MKSFSRLLPIALAFLLVGCDLSTYPIDEPAAVKIDARLLGKWKETKKKGKSDLYTLTASNDYHYLVTILQHGNKHDAQRYDAFLSDVDSARFLNVLYKDDSVSGYLLLRILNINAAGNTVTTTVVKDSTMQYLTSSTAVREKVRAHLNDAAFFGDTVRFFRVK